MCLTNKFQSNCMSYRDFHLVLCINKPSFSGQEFGKPLCTDFFINKCSYNIILTQPILMPTPSAISCTLTWRFSNTVFSTAWQFSLQKASHGRDVPTGAHTEGFFCLDETQQPNASPWHMMAHLHHIQQSFVCVSAAAERSPVSNSLSPDDSVFC